MCKIFIFRILKKSDFDPDPEMDPNLELREKSDRDPDIIFSDPKNCPKQTKFIKVLRDQGQAPSVVRNRIQSDPPLFVRPMDPNLDSSEQARETCNYLLRGHSRHPLHLGVPPPPRSLHPHTASLAIQIHNKSKKDEPLKGQ